MVDLKLVRKVFSAAIATPVFLFRKQTSRRSLFFRVISTVRTFRRHFHLVNLNYGRDSVMNRRFQLWVSTVQNLLFRIIKMVCLMSLYQGFFIPIQFQLLIPEKYFVPG